MKNSMDLAPVLSFLKKLRTNNNKPWFEAHRSEYEEAQTRFEDFVAALIIEMSKFEDLGGITPKDCMFRIYRDVRFSKDKSPYKTGMGASLGPGGRKSRGFPYFLHVSPGDHSMLAGGCHESTTEQMAAWRSAVDKDPSAIRKIVERKDFIDAFGGLQGEKLAKAPRGYPADHPDLELLKLKQVTVMHTATDKELLSPSVVQESAAIFKTMKPFLDYLGRILPPMA
ncbi:MAG TPA: DUF2461 domain-containing protein [Spirochaetia bacterium]|nr:DUF2461 domain-containing protein [Spirochaetia bacterium]